MKLTRYEPWSLLSNDTGVLNRLRNQLNQMFEHEWPTFDGEGAEIVTSNWSPSVDIKEENDKYVFIADIPGVDPKDIEVTAENGTLTIKGDRENEKKEEKKDYKRVERSWGSFYRRFSLPDNADADKIDAKSKNGVLEISIPKSESAKPRKIAIKS
jgi:HSP20 family protein